MGTTVELQPWLTLQAAGGIGAETQYMDEWVDTTSYKSAVLQIEAPQVSNCTLVLEGCDAIGGSFTTHAAITQAAAGACLHYLLTSAPVGAPPRLLSGLIGIVPFRFTLRFRRSLTQVQRRCLSFLQPPLRRSSGQAASGLQPGLGETVKQVRPVPSAPTYLFRHRQILRSSSHGRKTLRRAK